ncbi:MAG TPA: phage tail protein I [Hyphomicrobium sp.]|nr:phage tail protein I [Hyphomicrobium sp.]
MTDSPRALHLLPETSTDFEKALSATTARIDKIPTPLRDLWRWDTCPTPLLPWLAWALGVDFWIDSWPEDKKRWVIRNSFALKRMKGTLGGQRAYIDLAGSELYRWVRPPAKNFLGASTTAAEREVFLEKLPQIRIFPYRRTGNAGFRAFWRGKHGKFFRDEAGKPDCFAVDVDRGTKQTTRALYVYGPVTKELTWAALSDNGEQVMIPSTARRSVFTTSFTGNGFFRKSDSESRIVTLDLDRTSSVEQLLYRFPVVPKLTPVNVVPTRLGEKGFAPRSVMCGTPIGAPNRLVFDGAVPKPLPPLPNGASRNGKRYFVPSGSKYRIYDVVYLSDPDAPQVGRGAHNFMGHVRFGIPNFTAELKVVVPGKRPKWAADRFIGGYFYKAPKTNLQNTITAMNTARSLRDTVLLDTEVARPLRIGTPLFLGNDLILGQYTRS